MSEDLVARALEEHGHLVRKRSQATVVHLPDSDASPSETECYALDGVPTRVLESSAQIPMGATLCKLCQHLDTGVADTGEYTADDIRELSEHHPEKVREFLDEHGTDGEGRDG